MKSLASSARCSFMVLWEHCYVYHMNALLVYHTYVTELQSKQAALADFQLTSVKTIQMHKKT